MIKRWVIVLFVVCSFATSKAQTWETLAVEFNTLFEANEPKKALVKSQEIVLWVKNNLGDTSVHYPESVGLIGSAYSKINNDSSLFYFDKALSIFKKQKRTASWQAAIIHYNKSFLILNTKNSEENIKEIKIVLDVFSKENWQTSEIYIRSLLSLCDIYTAIREFKLAEPYYLESKSLIKKTGGDSSELYVDLLVDIGDLYKNLHNTKLAESYYLESLAIVRAVAGEEDKKYAFALNNLGFFYYNINNYSSAETTLKQALKSMEVIFGKESKEYAFSLRNLGNVYKDQNRYKLALECFEECLKIREKVLGKIHNDYATSLSDLAEVFSLMDNYSEAEKYYKECIDLTSKTKGIESYEFAICLRNLGNLYFDISEFTVAEDYYKKSITLREKLFGKNSDEYTTLLNDLGNLYSKIGDLTKAEYYYTSYLESTEKIIGEYSSDYSTALSNLGSLYHHKGDYAKAIALHLQSIELYQKFKLHEDLDYAQKLNNLGNVYLDIEDYTSSEKYFTESLKIRKEILGETHLDYSESLVNLGIMYYYKGDYYIAEKYYLQSQNIVSQAIGKTNDLYASILNNLGLVNLSLGNYEKAEKFFSASLTIKKDLFGDKYPGLVSSYTNIGNTYLYSGDNSNAIGYYNNALKFIDFKSKFLIKEQYSVLGNLGLSYYNIGKYNEAKDYFEKVANYCEHSIGKENSLYAHCLNNIGNVYLSLKNYVKAEQCFYDAFVIREKVVGNKHPDCMASLNNLGLVNYFKGDFNKCFYYYNKVYTNKIEQLGSDFNWLTEQEKEEYWKKEIIFFNSFFLLAEKLSVQVPLTTEMAFNASLISKGILLQSNQDLIKSIEKSNDTEMKELYATIKTKQRLYGKEISENHLQKKQLERDKLELDSLENALGRKIPQLNKSMSQFKNPFEEVKSVLTNDEIAIEFVRIYDFETQLYNYIALLVKQDDIHPGLIKLCSEKELSNFSPEHDLNEIYNLLWKPILTKLTGIKTIYYSPVGLLNNIPFHALFDYKNEQRSYVIDNFTLHQLTSTRYLALGLKEKNNSINENTIALFGGVNYDEFPSSLSNNTNAIAMESAFLYKNLVAQRNLKDSTRTGLSYLPGTKQEVENIAKGLKQNNWDVSIIEGKDASEAKVKSFTGSYSKSILHIATHGFAFSDKEDNDDKKYSIVQMNQEFQKNKIAENPMIRSGLLFSGANMTWLGKGDSLLNATHEDGILTAYELSHLSLDKTKLVVLSACETGKGAIQGSEGTFGLKRALKLAGVDNMIVSLWEVPDEPTMELMTLFYEELAKSKNPVTSFELAQKTMRNKYPENPENWAGFVLIR